MGNCSCLAEKEKHDVTIEAGSRRTVPKSAEMETKAESTTPQKETKVDFDALDVLLLQVACRGYLVRKRKPHVEVIIRQPQVLGMEAAVLPEDEEPELDELLATEEPHQVEDFSNAFKGDPFDLLSPPVRKVLSELPPFVYPKNVKGTKAHGPIKLSNGSCYIGEWHKGARFGKGVLFNIDGSYHEGYWKNGILHYKGRVIYSSGDYYDGDLVNGVREGAGKLVSLETKSSYEGSWKEDKQHGEGTEHFLENNSTYTGHFALGVKEGYGEFQWSDGSKYTGEFKNNKLDGVGHYIWSDKREYDGDWKENQMHGKGKFTWPDGRVYEGDYNMDKKEGYGVYHWEQGKIYEGSWLDGKMHGEGWLTVPGKPRKRYAFANGKKGNAIEEPASTDNQ